METNYNKYRKTLKYKILRFIWVKGRRLSTWAGKKIVKKLQEESKKDINNENKNKKN